mgnify:CR=1 FL=1
MPIEPIKIPQNVYIEDRIVGPLTLKQVIIVTIGGGFSYALWAMLSKTYGAISIPIQVMVWLPALGCVMAALGLAVAIPAVLGYNALVRGNKALLLQLKRFAHDVHALQVTGARVRQF